ncbi:hypothetical protein NADFUDRAFT_83091 [Nadsonia fulvescens var. elongata DSM 6958]|uniref:Integral membrane protein n=1 Tax=Nadsonia fulvescens var. elongata DSM 6958 TaxID=857566 RepID=A0A1E3PJD7_9ASCO|nr:hypothetical protein NADFUDRAFT_83091 [Nadsonia fulvescens var. elongata DSM 6958]
MQVVYYLIALVLILFMAIVSGKSFTFSLLFSWESVRVDNTLGWTLGMLWLLDTFFCVLALTVIVGRSKLALDFTLTLHGINVLICWLWTGRFPRNWTWWGLQLASVILMYALGRWTTQWRELRATFFESGFEMVPVSTAPKPSTVAPTSPIASWPESPASPEVSITSMLPETGALPEPQTKPTA